MADVYWLLDASPAVPVDAATGEQLLLTPGVTRTLSTRITKSGTDWAATTGEPCVTGFEDRYDAVREWLRYPGSVVGRGVDATGIPWYVERTPSQSPVDTQLISVRPPDAVDVPDFYALVVGGSDRTPAPQHPARLDLELWVLGPASDYSDRADVIATHDES